MENNNLIAVTEIYTQYALDIPFIEAISAFGFIEIIQNKKGDFILQEQLHLFERVLRLHHKLEINLEGIDAIYLILQKMESMQAEVNRLKNKLAFYADELY